MGLLQKAVETYDHHASHVGKLREGHTPLAPISHILTSAQLEITLNAAGAFLSAREVDRSKPKIIIPATEASAGRTSAPCAHPLCDNLAYVAPHDPKKHALYVEQLKEWAGSPHSHPKLLPILTYVTGGTILDDLTSYGLIQLKANGVPENDKLLVRWCVLGLEDGSPPACWKDHSLFDAFINFYSERSGTDSDSLCMITGKRTRAASQHPKGIIPINGNAKLISSNDQQGFTFRGRFTEDRQAAEIGYEASQKAHNALRWLASEQGTYFGGRTFLCWNPEGKMTLAATGVFAQRAKPIHKPTDYRRELKNTLNGLRTQLTDTDSVVIAAFDAATTGRLALTYYNELTGSDFLERLYAWDAHCCWPTRKYGIQSPPLWQIVHCAFGTQRGNLLDTDDRVMRQQMQRLVACRLDRAAIPSDILSALVDRASTPLAYEPATRETLLSTACAVIKKYRYDQYKEEWDMALEPNKPDRSYQFGRLLAVLEAVERRTYRPGETRQPNAIRMQAVFRQRPFYAADQIHDRLEQAYFPKLNQSDHEKYKNLLGEIMEQLSQFPENELRHPLRDTYLMGYYLQRNALEPSKSTNMEDAEYEHTEE